MQPFYMCDCEDCNNNNQAKNTCKYASSNIRMQFIAFMNKTGFRLKGASPFTILRHQHNNSNSNSGCLKSVIYGLYAFPVVVEYQYEYDYRSQNA